MGYYQIYNGAKDKMFLKNVQRKLDLTPVELIICKKLLTYDTILVWC